MVYGILLLLIIFVISCDNRWVRELKKKIPVFFDEVADTTDILAKGVAETTEKVAETVVGGVDTVNLLNSLDKIDTFTDGNDYTEVIQTDIDPEIIESHRQYTEDSAYLASTGASRATARDDFMPAVPFHGLPRTAHYRHLGAQSGARTGQSETPETVIDLAHHNSTRYCL